VLSGPDLDEKDDQVRMMDAMARKKTLIPIVKGEDFFENLSHKQEVQFDAVLSQFSACDVIFELDSGDSLSSICYTRSPSLGYITWTTTIGPSPGQAHSSMECEKRLARVFTVLMTM
jgi:hypothetical protein